MNRERGRKGEEKRKREPIGMAEVFDFQMPVICVVLQLIIRVTSTITTANF